MQRLCRLPCEADFPEEKSSRLIRLGLKYSVNRALNHFRVYMYLFFLKVHCEQVRELD